MIRIIYMCVFLVLLCISLSAQQKSFKGKVYDDITNQPIPFSTISLYHDSLLVGGTLVDSTGVFQIKSPKNWTHIEVSFIGFNSLIKTKNQIGNEHEINFYLSKQEEWLEEVVVSTQKASTELKIDRKIINLGSDIQNMGVNALEALDQISEIEVDVGNNKLSLRGNENLQILINGKPSAIAAIELLTQFQASEIDHIEVITSPSVKYQSNGISGIINVVLRKENTLGLNANAFANTGTRRYSVGASGNYSTSNMNYRLNSSKGYRKETNIQTIYRQFDNGFVENIFTPYELSGEIIKVGGGMDFFLNDKHEFSIGVDYTDDSHKFLNQSQFSNGAGDRIGTYARRNAHQHKTYIFDVNYRFKIDNPQHFLELDCQINDSKNSYPFEDSENNTFLQEQFLTEDFIIQSIAADYSWPISKKALIELGIGYNTQFLESQRTRITIDSIENAKFKYDESVLSIFGLLHLNFKKLQIQAGLRFEQFKSDSQILNIGFRAHRLSNNSFPSIHLFYKIDDLKNLNFGYSRRVNRPNFHHTNALQVVNPLFNWIYNPNIIPEISNNIDVSFQQFNERWSIGLTTSYRFREDVILWVVESKDNRQVFQYKNAGNYHSFGFEFDSKYELTDSWNVAIAANYYHNQINSDIEVTWSTNYSSRIKLKNTWKVNKHFIADAVYTHTPKIKTAFSIVRPRNRLDVSVNGIFAAKRLSIGLRVVDIFNQNVIDRTTQTSSLYQETKWDIQYQTRSFLVNLSYKLFDRKVQIRNEKARKYNKPLID